MEMLVSLSSEPSNAAFALRFSRRHDGERDRREVKKSASSSKKGCPLYRQVRVVMYFGSIFVELLDADKWKQPAVNYFW